MKWLFFILLLANLAFFGVMQLAEGRGGEPMESHKPYQADKIALLTEKDLQKLSEQKPAAHAPAPAVCLEWGVFGGEGAARAQQALDKLQLGEGAVTRRTDGAGDFWVYIPPLASRQAAQKKAAGLKALGIGEYYMVQDAGKWRNAISLGVFSTEEAAGRHLAQLQEKGLKSAVVAPRSHDDQTTFVIRRRDEKTEADLVELKQAFPGSELKAAECK